jgi:hypothetical protein
MAVQARLSVFAVLVLLVLFTSQAAYATQAQDRPNGHCAGAAPPADGACRLPLWLTCCDDHAAVGTALFGPGPGSQLMLPLAFARVPALTPARSPAATRVEIPPDTPLSRSGILLI